MRYSKVFTIIMGGVLLVFLLSFLPGIISPELPDPVRLTRSLELGFSRIQSFLILFGLALFWWFLFHRGGDGEKSYTKAKWIPAGLLGMAVMIMGVNFLVNPRGIYPVHLVEARVEDSRKVKEGLYHTTARDQQIIILGSSRSYSFSPIYIQETLQATAFNFSVFNGRVSDFIILTDYVFGQARVKPELLIVEVNPFTSFDPEVSLNNTSSAFFPYMDPVWKQEYFILRARNLVSVDHFSDAVYTFFYRMKYPENPFPWLDWVVFADGGADRPVNPYFGDSLDFIKYSAAPECSTEDLELQALYLERLVQTSQANGTGVIFVVTPWHPEYMRSVLAGSESYMQCMSAYDAFFSRLQNQYDQVYYHNYADLDDIQGDASELGFYDHQHVTPQNANRIIDALSGTIRDAMDPTP